MSPATMAGFSSPGNSASMMVPGTSDRYPRTAASPLTTPTTHG